MRLYVKIVGAVAALCANTDVLASNPEIVATVTSDKPGAARPVAPAAVRAMAGGWHVARLDEWPDTCAIRLTGLPTIGGYAVVLGAGCDRAFAPRQKETSWSADIYAWRPGAKGTVVLADALRHSMITFTDTRMGTGGHAWIGHGPDGQDYELMRDRHPGKRKVMSDE